MRRNRILDNLAKTGNFSATVYQTNIIIDIHKKNFNKMFWLEDTTNQHILSIEILLENDKTRETYFRTNQRRELKNTSM